MSPQEMERVIASQARALDHLRERVETLQARLLHVSEEATRDYRRGYAAGWAAGGRGDARDPEKAELRRRTRNGSGASG